MNNSISTTSSALEEQFARRVTARLDSGNAELPHDIGERLRVARQQALSRKKVVPQLRPAPAVVSNGGNTATIGGRWWTRVGSVVPLVALVAGLVTISVIQDNHRASELADVDSALLTGDLPTAAYTDPGFVQFLKADDADTTSVAH